MIDPGASFITVIVFQLKHCGCRMVEFSLSLSFRIVEDLLAY